MKLRVVGILLCIVVGRLGCLSAAETATNDLERFHQDRFAIGAFWLTFPDDEMLDARFGEIAEANFTLVFGPVGASSLESARKHVELCAKHQLRAIVYCRGVADEELPVGDACWGYRLWDEPNAERFGKLAKQVDNLRKVRPGRLGYVNLFPNYANAKQLGANSYDAYVKRFVETVDVDVLCMDHYTIFKPSTDSRERYCRNLETMRKYSLKKGIPFWNYFNVMPFGPHTDPTESQIRWQIFSSLAYGAKGVIYFNYGTPKTFEFPKGGGIIRRDGTRTRHWYQAKRINAIVKNLGPTLMQLENIGVFRVKPGDDPASVLAGTPIKTMTRADVDPPHDYLIGVFQHLDGRRAVLLNNYRYAYTAWPTVEFDVPLEHVSEIDRRSGKAIPVYDDSPDMTGLQISLDAGEGRLFLLPPLPKTR
jgi:hypothetical protein